MSEHDALASSLHAVIPEAMPEIIPVAIPDGRRLILVLRVDADEVPHPVMVSGKVLFRIPGHSAPADRQRVLDLVARDQAARDTERGRTGVLRPVAPDGDGHMARRPGLPARTGALRVVGGLELPGGYSTGHGWTPQRARQLSTRSTTVPSGRAPLGEAAYGAALARGAAMDVHEVVDYTLGQFRRLAALLTEPGEQASESTPGPARPSGRE